MPPNLLKLQPSRRAEFNAFVPKKRLLHKISQKPSNPTRREFEQPLPCTTVPEPNKKLSLGTIWKGSIPLWWHKQQAPACWSAKHPTFLQPPRWPFLKHDGTKPTPLRHRAGNWKCSAGRDAAANADTYESACWWGAKARPRTSHQNPCCLQ